MVMATGLSAHLTIYNDFDILPYTLRAIAPYVDEVVVVDGAYEWMVPYLQAIGINPDNLETRLVGIPFMGS
jgi:hypothetical protein